jgi:acyl-CoA thioesterase-1
LPSTSLSADLKTVLILGDSISAGFGVEPDEAYPALLQRKVEAAHLPFVVQNAGVSGDTSAGGLRRIDWVLKKPIDVLVLELGGNDGLRGLPLAQTRTNLQLIIQKARDKYPNLRVIVAGMQMPPNMGEDYQKEFENIFPELAKKNKADLIPFILEGVGGRDDLNQPDRIHPNAEGHQKVAETVWTVLKPVLEALSKK